MSTASLAVKEISLNSPINEVDLGHSSMRGRWIRRIVIFAFIVLSLAVVANMIVRITTTPAEGVIKATALMESEDQKKIAYKHFDGKYFDFEYPSTYRVVDSQQAPNLETLTLIGSNHSSKTLAFTVTNENLSSDSGVNLRRQNKANYIEKPVSTAGQTGIIFTAQKNFEEVAFIAHEPLVLSFALSDPNGNDYSSEYDKMLASLIWK